jgi:hypothetical protein
VSRISYSLVGAFIGLLATSPLADQLLNRAAGSGEPAEFIGELIGGAMAGALFAQFAYWLAHR